MTKDYKDDILHLNTQDRKREKEKRERRESERESKRQQIKALTYHNKKL